MDTYSLPEDIGCLRLSLPKDCGMEPLQSLLGIMAALPGNHEDLSEAEAEMKLALEEACQEAGKLVASFLINLLMLHCTWGQYWKSSFVHSLHRLLSNWTKGTCC